MPTVLAAPSSRRGKPLDILVAGIFIPFIVIWSLGSHGLLCHHRHSSASTPVEITLEISSMALTPSTMIPLGTSCPTFALTDTMSGKMYRDTDFKGKPLLVMFLCNHCPFVVHVQSELAHLGQEYAARGIAVVGICSNDVESHPSDSPTHMVEMAKKNTWTFPYLHDATQEVARAFHAACTPDFFLFDARHQLVYRGQLDDSRPKSATLVTGSDLRAALDAILNGRAPAADQRPSMGCNIKWKAHSSATT